MKAAVSQIHFDTNPDPLIRTLDFGSVHWISDPALDASLSGSFF